MAYEPSPVVLAALHNAAVASNVPLSLLWGVAFAESSFDPSKVGPLTSNGQHAVGLMQLMPDVLQKYGVTDPFDPEQSALAGARFLAALAKPLKWDVVAMLSAYVWGAANYARAQSSGARIPSEVTTYVRRALAARDVYRNKADRPPGSLMRALDIAINNLAALNPTWAPATQTRDAWRGYYAQHSTASDTSAVMNPLLTPHWRSYQIAYERAPITDETTPRPELVEPDAWKHAAVKVESIKHAVSDAATGLGAGLFVVALFVFAVSTRRR